MHQPRLFVVEVCAALARRTSDSALAREAGRVILELPAIMIIMMYELDHALAATVANVAATCALRGADAVYVATASVAQTALVTLDREVISRAAAVVPVYTPGEWRSSMR